MKYISATLLIFLSTSVYAEEAIKTESTTDSTVTTKSETTTTLKSPPASAIIPTMNNANSDLCTVGIAGAVQTQILGLSAGKTVRDMNCERLKNAKTLYDMGMKVAAVSVMCQDKRVFDAMMHAGTPCPYEGMIGDAAKAAWRANEDPEEEGMSTKKKTWLGGGSVAGILAALLLL